MMEFVYAYAYFILYAFLGWVCEDLLTEASFMVHIVRSME